MSTSPSHATDIDNTSTAHLFHYWQYLAHQLHRRCEIDRDEPVPGLVRERVHTLKPVHDPGDILEDVNVISESLMAGFDDLGGRRAFS